MTQSGQSQPTPGILATDLLPICRFGRVKFSGAPLNFLFQFLLHGKNDFMHSLHQIVNELTDFTCTVLSARIDLDIERFICVTYVQLVEDLRFQV